MFLRCLKIRIMVDAIGKMLCWRGGDDNIPCTCAHVGCYARCWVGVGGMITFLAPAHMLDATQDAGLAWGG